MNSENESDSIMSSISADHLSMPILLPPGNQNTTTTSSNMSQTSNELMEHDEAVENDEAMENDEPVDVNLDKNVCSSIFQILKQYELEDVGNVLKCEARIPEDVLENSSYIDVNKILLACKNERTPTVYSDAYSDLIKFVNNSLNIYQPELQIILYPVFVHIYLKLIYDRHNDEAVDFFNEFRHTHKEYYQNYITLFSCITSREQIVCNDMVSTFRNTPFTIRISRDIVSLLNRFLKEKYNILLDIIEHGICFDTYEGVARNWNQVDIMTGAFAGESRREDNKCKVYYGLLKEPDLQSFLPPEDDDDDSCMEVDRPKKKKPKKDPLFNRKAKSDPNSPQNDRLPLPELRDIDKLEKIKAIRESSKRVTLGADSLPSICCYTIVNAKDTASCAEICEDGSILSVGFKNNKIKLWSLNANKLKSMKNSELLQTIDIEAEDVMMKIMDEKTGETCKTLYGHNGPVYGLSFSPDRALLLSCSEDGSVRLWCLLVWACLVVYKGHVYPVWDIEFSPFGYYFVTAGNDKSARLWTTDNYESIRLFCGHYNDVDVVKFHPNSNYVATGSSDRTIRLWDCVTGAQVRLLTGHKGTITTLCFSTDGRFLVSAATDYNIHVWELSHGHLLAIFSGHTSAINTLAFSRDGNILVSGSKDCTIRLWDFVKFTEGVSFEDIGVSHNQDIAKDSNSYALRTFRTKQTPVLNVFFTRRNVLYAVCGSEIPSSSSSSQKTI